MKSTNNLYIQQSILFVIFASILFIFLAPIEPRMPNEGLDPSWFYVMDYSFVNNFLFPKELLFTYGPFGSFHYPNIIYNKETILLHYIFTILLTFLISISMIKILKNQNLFISLIVLFGVLFSLIFPGYIFWYFLQTIFIFLIYNLKSKSDILILFLVLFAISFSGLVKFSYVPSAFLIVIITDIFVYFYYKKIFAFTIFYLFSFIALYVLSGQPLADFGNFLIGSWHIASGFSGAMQTIGWKEDIIIFLSVSIIGFITSIYFIHKHKVYFLLYIIVSSSILLFIAFKSGFVRHDSHALASFEAMALIFAFFVTTGNKIPSKLYKTITVTLLLLSTFFLLDSIARYWNTSSSQIIDNYISKLTKVSSLFTKEYYHNLDNQYKNSVNIIKSKHSLPRLNGTVDIYPWNQAILLASGLNYRPRPVFQSYSVYTPELIQRNKKFLYSKNAPKYILFTIKNIDDRYPGMMEGATWLDLMKQYDIIDHVNEFYILKKTTRDKDYSLKILQEINSSWGKEIIVPDEEKIYMKVEIKKTLFGKLFKLLFKSPIVYIDIQYADGHNERKKLIPSIASEGFILSPYIASSYDFFKFSINTHHIKKSNCVKSIKFLSNNNFFYQDNINISFQNIETLNFTLSDKISNKLQNQHKLDLIYEKIIDNNNMLNKNMFHLINYDNKKSIFAHEGIEFYINSNIIRSINNTVLYFGYGISKDAYSGNNNVEGGCFTIYGVNQNNIETLWNKCIDPKHNNSDRGIHYEKIILDAKYQSYKFSTTPISGKSAKWGWTFWTFTKEDIADVK